MPVPVIAIFDIGKTNKKFFLFDEDYSVVWERSGHFDESVDEDGDPCDDIQKLISFIRDCLSELAEEKAFSVKAINAAAYGASFVYINSQGDVIAPLYNYLKAYPEKLKKKFYDAYDGEVAFSSRTASPVLGSLNSGMQLFRIKYEKPGLFGNIKYALHLPQFVSFLTTGKFCSEITSIGCHTNLWDFEGNRYHDWVRKEGIAEKLPPIVDSDEVMTSTVAGAQCLVGPGLHDSSAALIPYLLSFSDSFILISTGTWCISLNPFNHQPLTKEELASDCLCYLQFNGKPVKASRLFAGKIHDDEVARIANNFNLQPEFFTSMDFNPEIFRELQKKEWSSKNQEHLNSSMDDNFSTAEENYHRLIFDIMKQQQSSTQLILKGSEVRHLYVDGGFCKNALYMNMLASFFPDHKVYAADMANATALGAALAIHDAWNTKQIPRDHIELKLYAATRIR